MRGGESKRCPGYATQRARAGAYARVRLPQFGRPERWPEHARAAHWTAAPSLPQCCVPIGRRLLGSWAEPSEPTLWRALGGALGRPVCFCPMVPVGPPALPNAPLRDPSYPSEDATKWRWGRSQGRSSWDARPFSPAEGLSQDLWGLGGDSARCTLSRTPVSVGLRATQGRTLSCQPRATGRRGRVRPLRGSFSLRLSLTGRVRWTWLLPA